MHYDTKNKGTLWLETELKTDRSPNFTGTLDVNGKEYRIVGWNKTTKTGKDLISLAISEPQPKSEGGSWEQAREKFKKDEPLTDIDEEISDEDLLKSIPF